MSKIKPKDQSEELRRAKLEFIMRNPEERQKLTELLERNKQKRDEVTTALATIGGKFSPEQKERWNFLYQEAVVDEELAEYLKKRFPPNAANSTYPFESFAVENAHHDVIKGKLDIFHMSRNTLNEKYLDYLCQHAREIFTELTNGEPSSYLLVGIDLRRSKDVIKSEFENLPMVHNLNPIKALTTKMPKNRFKWPANIDKMLAVWDMREKGKSFAEISDFLKIKAATAKKQFYLIFSLINHEPYNKRIWKNLIRERLERIAKTEKPTNKKFWDQVLKLETTPQNDFIPKNKIDEEGKEQNPFEVVGEDAEYEPQTLFSDIEKLCTTCPDKACRANTLKCLSDYRNGDPEAFERFTPDCPKLYNYLKS